MSASRSSLGKTGIGIPLWMSLLFRRTSPLPTCGRLVYVSTTALSYLPFNGDLIKISGVLYQIPSGGIVGLANTGVYIDGVAAQNLAASTLYYVYAFNNRGVV